MGITGVTVPSLSLCTGDHIQVLTLVQQATAIANLCLVILEVVFPV